DYIHLIFLMLTDLFLIRRFVDKNYITNTIAYSGGHHSEDYIYILVKYFDFKVTHYSFARIDDLKKINDMPKNFDSFELFYYNKLFKPYFVLQCSSMQEFPENFE